MAAGDLSQLDSVKRFVGVSASANHDELLRELITGASAWMSQFCNRTFPAHDVTGEIRNGTGGKVLLLRDTPVISVASLTIDDRVIPARSGAFSSGYIVQPNAIWLTGYLFERGVGNVTISYRAGYATIPADLDHLCKEIVAARFRERDHTGQSTVNLGNGQTVSFRDEDIPKFVRTGLVEGGWRRVVQP